MKRHHKSKNSLAVARSKQMLKTCGIFHRQKMAYQSRMVIISDVHAITMAALNDLFFNRRLLAFFPW